MPGPTGNNEWRVNKITLLDHGPGALNWVWAAVARSWDAVCTGLRINYENKAHKECEQLDKIDGTVIVCSQGHSRYPAAETQIFTDHHEILSSRIWLHFQDFEAGDDEVASHEFGHALGLGHYSRVTASGVPVSIMHPGLTIGSIHPTPVDITALGNMGYLRAANPASRVKHRRRR